MQMVIKPNCGPHSGKVVEVLTYLPGWNPTTDTLDSDWCAAIIPDGPSRIGAIEISNLTKVVTDSNG